MQIRILEMNPTATEGRGALAIEALIEKGYRLHGHPVVWRDKLLQTVVLDEPGSTEVTDLTGSGGKFKAVLKGPEPKLKSGINETFG